MKPPQSESLSQVRNDQETVTMAVSRDDVAVGDTTPPARPFAKRRPGEARVEEDLGPGDEIDAYVIRHRIARGGYATVYQAEHRVSGRQVAIKVLHHALLHTTDAAARFEQEVRMVHRIDSPHIVQIEGLGQLRDGRRYYAMELLGNTLAQVLAERGWLPPPEALEILEPVCAALGAAHEVGCVHRDIKASNIAVTLVDGTPAVRLLDFGIAKVLEGSDEERVVTEAGVRLGTPSTAAPEQILGRGVSPATDIYALGVLLFRMLTGRYPFAASDPLDIERMHLKTPPPRPSLLVPLAAGLDAVMLRCLEKHPGDRYDSVDTFLAALRKAISEPAQASSRSTEAFALYLELALHQGDPADLDGDLGTNLDPNLHPNLDDDLDDELDKLMARVDEATEMLEDHGYQVRFATERAVLGVRVPHPEACERMWQDAQSLARSLHERVSQRAEPRMRCTVVVHCGMAEVRSSPGEHEPGGYEVVGGDIERLGTWMPDDTGAGVFVVGAPSRERTP